MANKKISELPYINVSKISGNTLVPLVTYFSAATGDTVHTYIDDLQTYLISGLTGNTDVFVTGGTYSAGTITITNNTGGTFNITGVTFSGGSSVVGDYLPLSGGTVSGGTQFTAGLTANTISATTYLNLPINTDVFVTGGTYSSGEATFTNNTGGTFNVTGFYTGETSYVNSLTTGVGLSADTTTGNITIINTDPDQTVTISGGTAITTGGTYPNFTITNSAPDQTVTLSEGTNISITGTYPNFTLDVTGLTDNDVFITGFTYDNNNKFTISKNSGSSLNATINLVSGLTVNGNLSVTGDTNINNLSATTISATTYQNLPDNVTGYYLPLSGGTVSGSTIFTQNISVTGGTGINWFSGNTSTDLLRVTQTGTGNAFVVEDSTNPDNSPFIITSGGSTFIGSLTGHTSAGGVFAKLEVSDGNSGVVFSGLPNVTTAVFQSDQGSNIGLLSPDANNSQIYFGTPSDAFGAYLRWDFTNRNLILSTASSTGKIIFKTGTDDEVARIDQSGNFGIGLTGATQKFEVSGNSRIIGTLSANTISATTYQNLPNSLSGLYLPTSGGTVSGNTIFTSGLTASTTTINGNLTVTGNTNIKAFTGTTGYISGSGQNILTVIGSGNSTTSPLFTVQGSSGELFSVNDSLVGSLFSVNDISGLPILEVFSDNTTLMGSYQAPSLNTTTKVTLTAGTNTIYSIPTSAYTGAFIDYTLVSTGTTGARAGNIMTIWSGTSANFTETQTTDIGTTTGVTFTVAVSGNNAVLSSSATTTGWTLKTIVRSI